MKAFNKNIFTPMLLIKDIAFFIRNIPSVIGAIKNRNIPMSFSEKIMLVVTSVNDCRYCEWFHAKQALKAGLKHEEIQDILALQFSAIAKENEITALLFAQHYAETNRHPEKQMIDSLFDYYDKKTAGHILIIIRMILFGNLSGNTYDAFLSRLKGCAAPNSSIVFECIFFTITTPIYLPAVFFMKKYKGTTNN